MKKLTQKEKSPSITKQILSLKNVAKFLKTNKNNVFEFKLLGNPTETTSLSSFWLDSL